LWGTPPEQIRSQHFAFEVALPNLPAVLAELQARQVKIRNFLDDGTEIPTVFGWIPAVSMFCGQCRV
jgi:hypothetical protein